MKVFSGLTVFIFSVLLSINAFAACNDEKFSPFLEQFKSDISFSKERTKWPLLLTEEEFGDSSTRKSRRIKSGVEFWALKKSIPEFLKENVGVETSVYEEKEKRALVTFAVRDADILFDAIFNKTKGCWYLSEITEYER